MRGKPQTGTAKRRATTAESKSRPKRAAPKRATTTAVSKRATPTAVSKRATPTAVSKHRSATKPQNIDEYLARFTPEQRSALQKLRRAVRAAAPRAEECISYGLAAFRVDGKVLVGFGASAKHCAFYPMSGRTISAHASKLKAFVTTKGSIHFDPRKPLPPSLVATLTRARIAELRG
jgi:uncharacterized protein YdhG (YjbR/CyaY superfamily)